MNSEKRNEQFKHLHTGHRVMGIICGEEYVGIFCLSCEENSPHFLFKTEPIVLDEEKVS